MSITPEPTSQSSERNPNAISDQPSNPANANLPNEPGSPTIQKKPMRLWPIWVIVLLALAFSLGLYFRFPDNVYGILGAFGGPLLATIMIMMWWLFFSRLTWAQKGLGALGFIGIGVGVMLLAHKEMTLPWWVMGVPLATIIAALFWSLTFWLPKTIRVVGLVAVILLAISPGLILRYPGSIGRGVPNFMLRWQMTSEEKGSLYRAPQANAMKEAIISESVDWTQFRGPNRAGVVNMTIPDGWIKNPGEPLWKHPCGMGWSSFVVVGDYLFTQEQRKDKKDDPEDKEYEVVVCYEAETGKEVWTYRNGEKPFHERQGGPGPRATPTFDDGHLYTMSANGVLSCVNAQIGEKSWEIDIAKYNKTPIPQWGFSASPLVWNDFVIVQGGGKKKQPLLLAFNKRIGKKDGELAPVWKSGEGPTGHCSPKLVELDGVEQILMMSGKGLHSFDPASGKELWKYVWPLSAEAQIVVMPGVIDDNSIVIGGAQNAGLIRLQLKKPEEDEDGKWTIDDKVWEEPNTRFNPHFNDFVIHKGHLYGLNYGVLGSVNLEDEGKENWRRGRYGCGQILLVGDNLLVLSEEGDVVLVAADPKEFRELGRFRAIEG